MHFRLMYLLYLKTPHDFIFAIYSSLPDRNKRNSELRASLNEGFVMLYSMMSCNSLNASLSMRIIPSLSNRDNSSSGVCLRFIPWYNIAVFFSQI